MMDQLLELRRTGEKTYAAFNRGAFLESLRRVFKNNVCIVIWPYDAVNATAQRNKEAGGRKFLDGALHYFANFNIAHLQIFLLDDRRLQGKLQ